MLLLPSGPVPLLLPAVASVSSPGGKIVNLGIGKKHKVNLGGNIVATDKPMREREPHDHYPTPLEVCQAALKLIDFQHFVPYCNYAILDPGAGAGVWGKAARQRWSNAEIGGIDIRDIPDTEDYDAWFSKTDFFTVKGQPVDLVMGNPPYALAEQFVRKAISLTVHKGYVLFLLRLAFLEGQNRGAGLWREFPPQSVHVLSARPSFYPTGHPKAGNTDATAYAIYIWQEGWKGQTTLHWLDWKQSTASTQMDLFALAGVEVESK